jgi:hypothetical protein
MAAAAAAAAVVVRAVTVIDFSGSAWVGRQVRGLGSTGARTLCFEGCSSMGPPPPPPITLGVAGEVERELGNERETALAGSA